MHKGSETNPCNPQAGFTLMETVIALAITAMLTTACVGMVIQARQSSARITEVNAQAQRLLYLQTILRNDLDNIHPASGQRITGQSIAERARDTVLMAFSRGGWDNPGNKAKRTGSVRVEYRFEGAALIRRVWQSQAPNSETPYVDRVLYDGIRDIKLNFRSLGVWNPNWPPFDLRLPKAIILRLDLESGETLLLTVNIAHGL